MTPRSSMLLIEKHASCLKSEERSACFFLVWSFFLLCQKRWVTEKKKNIFKEKEKWLWTSNKYFQKGCCGCCVDVALQHWNEKKKKSRSCFPGQYSSHICQYWCNAVVISEILFILFSSCNSLQRVCSNGDKALEWKQEVYLTDVFRFLPVEEEVIVFTACYLLYL